MNKTQILQRIINESGDCGWSKTETCDKCPLGKLKIKPDGNYYNCIESVGIEGLSEEQANEKYRQAAVKVLLDLKIEETLED